MNNEISHKISKQYVTSFKHAAKQASLVDVNMSALSCPWIIAFGTLSKFHGRLQTLSINEIKRIIASFELKSEKLMLRKTVQK